MLMSVRYRWTGDVDENRPWVHELYTYVNYIQTCTKRTVNVRARLHKQEQDDRLPHLLGEGGNPENNGVFTYKPGCARMWLAIEYG